MRGALGLEPFGRCPPQIRGVRDDQIESLIRHGLIEISQDEPNSLTNMQLFGMTATDESAPLLSSTVEPDTESTLPLDPSGRLGQWILGTGLPTRDWELTGTITLTRPDEALSDRNKVRLAVDFIKDTTL